MSWSVKCPHCYEMNPAFEQQRCQHCGLLRMSDVEFKKGQQHVLPLLQQLEAMEAETLSIKQVPKARSLMKALEPWKAQYAFIPTLLTAWEQRLAPFQSLHSLPRKVFQFFLCLFLLMVIPLSAWIMGSAMTVISFLLLPPLVWIGLGIWYFRKYFVA